MIIQTGVYKLEYTTIKSDRRTLALEIKNGKLIVRAPILATDEEINEFITKHKKWIEKTFTKIADRKEKLQNIETLSQSEIQTLADKAMTVIPDRVKYYAEKIGVTYGKITIRNQRSRWGSCSSNGNLSFNCLLMLAPPEALDSVVVHELCHRKVMNHSDKFYAEVLRVFPDYRIWNKWLKENGDILIKRMVGVVSK
ncbi:MAG: M48 family metallopeptidase [Clostridia bacterium]|nr:M48 family metallopeptidase [Clostridia bacterium]